MSYVNDNRPASLLIQATLVALRHTGASEPHMPELKRIVEAQIGGPVTFAEIARALETVEVNSKRREWRQAWAELLNRLRRAESL